jgi:hypothetical protein
MPSQVRQLVESTEQSRTALLELVSGLRSDQAAFRPAEGAWSITEILEHLYLAELSGVTKIWAALERWRAGYRWDGDLPNRGQTIEEVVAATWQPREVAPPIATPHVGGPLAAWVAGLRSLRAVLQDLAAALEGVPLGEVVFPHYLSGPLDARQRLAFLRFRIDRHRAQVERVRASADFPE